MSYKVKAITSPYLSSKMYIVAGGGSCVLVDPCNSAEAQSALGELTPQYIFLTHEHFDHISGARLFAEKYGAEILCGGLCAKRLESPVANCSRHFNAFARLRGEPCDIRVGDYTLSAHRTVIHGQELSAGDIRMKFLYTPGHTDSGFSLLIGEMLFVGDTLLISEGRASGFDIRFRQQFEEITVPLLTTLSGNLTVKAGHGGDFLLKDYLELYNSEAMR